MLYLSQVITISDGVQRDFAVPFPVIKEEYIKVYKQAPDGNGEFTAALEPVGFIVLDKGRVRLGAPVPQGNRVIVRRETYADQPLVDFQDVAFLAEGDLDLATLQALHVAQEAKDQNGSNLEAVMNFFRTLQESLAKIVSEGQTVQGQLEAFIATVERLVAETEGLLETAERTVAIAETAKEIAVESSREARDAEYWSRLWASQSPEVEVKDGLYSSRHYADKAQASNGDMADHIGAEDPHPQYLRRDQSGDGFFEIDPQGDIQMRLESTILEGRFFYQDAWADIALF